MWHNMTGYLSGRGGGGGGGGGGSIIAVTWPRCYGAGTRDGWCVHTNDIIRTEKRQIHIKIQKGFVCLYFYA